eukprot:COSAG02_NODE_31630_length_530_cov_0.914153_1_plen_37_part_10
MIPKVLQIPEIACACCVLVAIDIWAGYNIYHIMSRDW